MIESIISLLKTNDFYNVDEEVDIAKGKYELPKNPKRIPPIIMGFFWY